MPIRNQNADILRPNRLISLTKRGIREKPLYEGYDMYEGTDFNSWDQADEMATKAFDLYENGEMPEALDQLNEAIQINPSNSAWHFNAGLTLDTLERFEDAVEAYEQALELSPDDPEILNSLAVDYTRTGHYDLALETFERIQKASPDFEPCYCNRIITYTEIEQHEEAEHMFYLAQQINPDCPICFYNIGNSLFTRQQYQKAIWCWKRTSELEPTHPQINYRIAQAYWADGDIENAKEHFLKELRTNPGDADVILDFGIFLLKTGDIENAKEKFNRILELDPDSAPALLYRGELALTENESRRAEEFFKLALTNDQNLQGPRYRLAQLALRENDNRLARQYLLQEGALTIEDEDILLSTGAMLANLGDTDRAVECFLKVLDQDQNCVEAFADMGSVLAKCGEDEGALQFFEHAIGLGGSDANLLAGTAFLYYKAGRLERATKIIATAQTTEPHNKNIAQRARRIRFAVLTHKIKSRIFTSRLWIKFALTFAKYKCHIMQLLKIRR